MGDTISDRSSAESDRSARDSSLRRTNSSAQNDSHGVADGLVAEIQSTREGGFPWAAGWALAGAAVWAGVAVLARTGIARFGVIELMFLFAPLVIVPLGMELGRMHCGGGGFAEAAQTLQPVGALLAVVTVFLPPGKLAGLAAMGWLVVCGLAAAAGLTALATKAGIVSGNRVDGIGTDGTLADVAAKVALIDLAVGGAWLVASRLGMRPMGIREPIGLLTAVHFHFAGFATATIASVTLRFADRGERRWLRWIVMAVVVLPFVVAAGFVLSATLKMVAAVAFSISVAGLAIGLMKVSSRMQDGSARTFLRLASSAVLAGMALAGTYAVTDFLKSDALTIPRMATTHGILNAGFCLMGLLGWLVESSRELRGWSKVRSSK